MTTTPLAYELIADGGIRRLFPTKQDAIDHARRESCEAFEVLDEDGIRVYAEWPQTALIAR